MPAATAVTSAAPTGYVLLDDKGFICEANPTAAWMLGMDRAKLVNAPLARFVARGDRRKLLQHLAICHRSTGYEMVITELKMTGTDGRQFEIELSTVTQPAPPTSPARVCFRTALVDITPRKQAEAALQASEEQYRLLFELNPNPMWIFDEATLRFLAVNEAAVKLYGWSRPEFLEMTINDIRPPKELPKLKEKLLLQGRHRAAFVGEWQHWKNDRSTIDVEVTISCIQFQGRAARLTMVNEITARKQAELQLKELNATLEQRVGNRTTALQAEIFLREAAEKARLEVLLRLASAQEAERARIGRDLHDDLCQHLTGVEFLAHSLAQYLSNHNPAGAARAREISGMARVAINRTRDLAHGLAPVELERGGLPGALRELCQRVKKVSRTDFRFYCAKSLVIQSHEMNLHLYRIAQEAINNAVKHGKARRLDIHLSEGAGHVELEVRDNGRGFPEKKSAGKGIGLQVMQHRANLMGGSVSVCRQRRGGTSVVCIVNNANSKGK